MLNIVKIPQTLMMKINEKMDKITQNRISHLEKVQSSCKEREKKAKEERKRLLNIQEYKKLPTTTSDDVKCEVEDNSRPKQKPVKCLTFNDKLEIFTETEINGCKVPIITVSGSRLIIIIKLQNQSLNKALNLYLHH